LRQAYDYWQNQPDNYPEPTPERGTPPLREADVSVTIKAGRRRIASSRGHQTPLTGSRHRATDSIAPTEFPREQSATGRHRARGPPTFAACIPRVEEARSGSSLFTGRYPPELAPERLLADGSRSQQSTDA
jgi:hypothetical protein